MLEAVFNITVVKWAFGSAVFSLLLLHINSLVLVDPPKKHKHYAFHPPWRVLNKVGKALHLYMYCVPGFFMLTALIVVGLSFL